jgi:hypothetical protein
LLGVNKLELEVILSRWSVLRTGACTTSCDLGLARRHVSCVEYIHGEDSEVSEERCHAAVKPATTVPCLVQVCTFRWDVKDWNQVGTVASGVFIHE